jgi:hypothetical protein
MTGYELSRAWFDFAFSNPEKIKPTHAALFFFAIENCNRMGWAEKFRLPSEMAMSAIGVHSYKTYISALNDLCEWGFLTMVQKSTNQYSANIVALVNFTEAQDKAATKALDNALLKQIPKQVQSIDSINKQETRNNKPETRNATAGSKKRKLKEPVEFIPPTLQEVKDYFKINGYTQDAAERAFRHYETRNWIKSNDKPVDNWKNTMGNNWFKPENKEPTTTSRYQTYNPEIHK